MRDGRCGWPPAFACLPGVLLLLLASTLVPAKELISPSAPPAQAELAELAESPIFVRPIADFQAYRSQLQTWLEARSMPQRTAQEIALNLPFERPADASVPYRGRYLLFHGLNDSPYVWHDMADVLVARGFDVRAVLLEGHGSTPRDMLDVTFRSWIDDARRHVELYTSPSAPLFLGGFSLGGVIATLLALENPDIEGLFLVSPAFHSQLDGYLRWSGLYSLFRPWVFGGMIREDNPIKYNSIPVNSGWQFYKATRLLKRQWNDRRITLPTLIVTTQDDSVVDIDFTQRLFEQRFTHPDSRFVVYSAEPVLAAAAGDVSRTVHRSSDFPALRILNQSHLGLMYAPDNPLFGTNGRVLVCNGNEYPIFMACMNGSDHWFGAQHTASPDTRPVARTTYNPDFDAVFDVFDQVFADSAR